MKNKIKKIEHLKKASLDADNTWDKELEYLRKAYRDAENAWDAAREARDASWGAYTAICTVSHAAEADAAYKKYIYDLATNDNVK